MDVAVRDTDRDSRRGCAQAGGDFFMEQGVDHAFFPFFIAAFLSSVALAGGGFGSDFFGGAITTGSAFLGAASGFACGRPFRLLSAPPRCAPDGR
jgi:hypothetical protein